MLSGWKRASFDGSGGVIRFRLRWLWAAVLLFAAVSGYWKVLLAVFVMMSLHEGAHCLMALWLGCPIDGVCLYPFGLCAQLDTIDHGSVWRALLILSAGPCMHLIFPLGFDLLTGMDVISVGFAEYLRLLNRSILLFNLLPIIPLDGGRIAQTVLQLFVPYGLALRLGVLVSFLTIIFVWVSGWMDNAAGFLTLCILSIQEIGQYRGILEKRMAFYHYRLTHPFIGRRKRHTHSDLYRQRQNMLYHNGVYQEEREWLKEMFHSGWQKRGIVGKKEESML